MTIEYEELADIDSIGEAIPLLEGLRTARAIRRLRPDPVDPPQSIEELMSPRP